MKKKAGIPTNGARSKDGMVVIGGAGGFIGGALARYFHDNGFSQIRAVDKKPLPEWQQRVPGVECLSLDLSREGNCVRACEGAAEVYNLRLTWAAWVSSKGFESNVFAASSSIPT